MYWKSNLVETLQWIFSILYIAFVVINGDISELSVSKGKPILLKENRCQGSQRIKLRPYSNLSLATLLPLNATREIEKFILVD